jgi:gamma-glutamyltranspeptidase/glutathione hydrolase
MDILQRDGGNAVDAAVASAFALAVVQPSASGLGGGGFMLVYQAKEKKVHALDFREKSPRAAHRNIYLKGGKIQSERSRSGALAVAVPGEVAGLVQVQRKFGRLALSTVLKPAMRLARIGIPIEGHLRQTLSDHLTEIKKSPSLAKIFLREDGTLPSNGDLLRQPDLARTLEAIGTRGEEDFYRGWIAKLMVSQLQAQGGITSQEDLSGYKVSWREPLLGHYRGNLVIGMPLPSAGGLAILEILNALEGYDLEKLGHNSATYLHLLAETMKQAFSDRARFLGDPEFVKNPTRLLLSKEHGASMRLRFSAVKIRPHNTYGFQAPSDGGTSHLNTVDSQGNVVACTLSINTSFGSKVAVEGAGFILNNQMDDFSIQPAFPNTYGLIGSDANGVEPGKKPLSSMAPTLLFQRNRPFLVLGASGGPRIISSVLQTMLNVLDFKMGIREAVEAPRIHHQWSPNVLQMEKGFPQAEVRSLERRGHEIQDRNSLGRVQAIMIPKGIAVADPRRDQRPTDQEARSRIEG